MSYYYYVNISVKTWVVKFSQGKNSLAASFKMHLSYSTTEKNHSIFMSKKEVMHCPPCYSINNSSFLSSLTIFPWWLWNTALTELALERLHFVPMEEAEFKITGKCLCESMLFLPPVPQAGFPEQPYSHGWPGCTLGKVWHQSPFQNTASGQTQFWGQAASFAPWKWGIWSKPATYGRCIWRERKKHPWEQVLAHPADRSWHSCSLVWSAGWALHQHTRHPPHISAPFLTWDPRITLLPHQGLAQNTEWIAKRTPFEWKKYSGYEGVHQIIIILLIRNCQQVRGENLRHLSWGDFTRST